jgi:hypothetical protein
MSGNLGYTVDRYAERGEEALTRLGQADRDEAARLMPYFDRATGPSRQEAIHLWLTKVGGSVARPPSPAEILTKTMSVMDTSSDLCIAAWTGETRALFSRSCAWWPSDAEVDKFLRPISNAIMTKHRALKRITADKPEPPPAVRGTPNERERAAVAASMAEISANLAGQPADGRSTAAPGKALHVSDLHLLAEYERAASQPGPFQALAQIRFDMLRKKIGRPS